MKDRIGLSQSSFIDAIEALLRKNWDPIGIVDMAAAQDEYQAYAAMIAGMVARGASQGALVEALLRFERDEMGLPGDEVRAERVAAHLLVCGGAR